MLLRSATPPQSTPTLLHISAIVRNQNFIAVHDAILNIFLSVSFLITEMPTSELIPEVTFEVVEKLMVELNEKLKLDPNFLLNPKYFEILHLKPIGWFLYQHH